MKSINYKKINIPDDCEEDKELARIAHGRDQDIVTFVDHEDVWRDDETSNLMSQL